MAPNKPLTVLLVEDDARIRERLAAAISANADLYLLKAAGSYAEARTPLRARRRPMRCYWIWACPMATAPI